jgi:hypothetical protein
VPVPRQRLSTFSSSSSTTNTPKQFSAWRADSTRFRGFSTLSGLNDQADSLVF